MKYQEYYLITAFLVEGKDAARDKYLKKYKNRLSETLKSKKRKTSRLYVFRFLSTCIFRTKLTPHSDILTPRWTVPVNKKVFCFAAKTLNNGKQTDLYGKDRTNQTVGKLGLSISIVQSKQSCGNPKHCERINDVVLNGMKINICCTYVVP